MGHTPSFTWRSMWRAKVMVMKGSRWNIGDGSNVNIWKDNWIPYNPGFKAIGKPCEFLKNVKVEGPKSEQVQEFSLYSVDNCG